MRFPGSKLKSLAMTSLRALGLAFAARVLARLQTRGGRLASGDSQRLERVRSLALEHLATLAPGRRIDPGEPEVHCP